MQRRICAIDGTYELFRSYFGAPGRVSPLGVEVGASFALAQGLWKLRCSGDFSHYCIAFDSVVESFRNQLFADYKNGEGIEPSLQEQFPLIEELCGTLGIRVLSMVEYEADDALATIAELFKHEVDQVVIASPDKDLLQVVDEEKVLTWDRMRGIYYNAAAAVEKLGVAPASVPDFLALVGDSADGIPGIARFGKKTASLLLSHYEHLENIPADAASWAVKVRGATTLAENLNTQRADAGLYKQLATLVRNIPLELELDALIWSAPDLKQLEAFCGKHGDTRLLKAVRQSLDA